jgi:SAM-dependent methyltransferase
MVFNKIWTDVDDISRLELMKRIKAICPSEDKFEAESALFRLIGNPTDPRSILDFGCGLGRNLKGMVEHSKLWHVTGYDNQAMLNQADDFLGGSFTKGWRLESDWEIVKKTRFDVIVVSLVLQHMHTSDVLDALKDFSEMTDSLVILSRNGSDYKESVDGLIASTGLWEPTSYLKDPAGCLPGHWLGTFKKREFGLSFSETFQNAGKLINERGVFVGCPLGDFEKISRDQLIVLLMEKLAPDSKVLDIGCGCLRAGSWLVHFLDKNCYYGIEPNTAATDQFSVLNTVFGGRLGSKVPTFSSIDSFAIEEAFGDIKFDFVSGLSIWSHSPKWAIIRMLEGFKACKTTEGKLIMSYFPTPHRDYQGNLWVGRSDKSDKAGVVGHDPAWLQRECAELGFTVRDLNAKILGQQWICIE